MYIYFFKSNFKFAGQSKKELRVTLQSSAIFLDPGGIQDSQSLLVSRQGNCQFIKSPKWEILI